MVADLVMPKLGLTMTEGVLAEWRVRPGERFRAGDVIVVVETDKIASEVEADTDGVLIETTIEPGETVPVGTRIARWERDGEATVDAAPTPSQAAPQPASAPAGARVKATPLARRRARELGIDIAGVTGSGPGGRIKMADVEAVAARAPAAPAAAVPQPAPAAAGERRKPSTLRQTMARRLAAAKREVPHFYLAAEAEVSDLLELRGTLNADTDGGAARLTLTHFVLAAVGRALAAMPEMDRVWDAAGSGEIVELGRGDVGMAVDTPRGLVAPVLRGAARLPLDRLAADASALTERARAGRLTAEDLQGGAVSVSNAGMHNVTYMTSIINPGQSSILGVGSVRPVFRPDDRGAPVLRRELGLVLSVDHRLFDGVTALTFLNRIIAGLERPLRLLRAG